MHSVTRSLLESCWYERYNDDHLLAVSYMQVRMRGVCVCKDCHKFNLDNDRLGKVVR